MKARRLTLAVVLFLAGWVGLSVAGAVAATGSPPALGSPLAGQPWEQWQLGPHAHTYDEGKGPNSYCARCHSPLNWDPASKIDPQPNCVSCKFPFDKSLRVAPGNPPVSEKDWKNIGCEICHRIENGAVNPGIAWRNAATHQYESLPDTTALCTRCHTDTETLRHRREMGSSTHVGFGCTSCHDAHSTAASCTAEGCHAGVMDSARAIPGHDEAHSQLTCGACHDASGLAIQPDPKSGRWDTIRTTVVMERSSAGPYQSHNLQRRVDCPRCHYPSNPWGLALEGRQEGGALSGTAPSQTSAPTSSDPAASETLSLVVTAPAEGETFYAGPSVMLYSFEMKGIVTSQDIDMSRVELRLEVQSGGQTVGRYGSKPHPDGSFSFSLTVNPDAYKEKFPPELASCETCHRHGDLDLPGGVIYAEAYGHRTLRQPGGDRAADHGGPRRTRHGTGEGGHGG